jgi:hypothetical protein
MPATPGLLPSNSNPGAFNSGAAWFRTASAIVFLQIFLGLGWISRLDFSFCWQVRTPTKFDFGSQGTIDLNFGLTLFVLATLA